MDAQTINIISLILTAVGTICAACSIWVALNVSKKSSKDIVKLIESNKNDSNNQIQTMKRRSEEEIKQIRIITHTFMIALIHSLESANIDTSAKKDEILSVASPLFARCEQISEQIVNALKDEENINLEQINSLFSERRDIEEKIKKAFNDMCKVNEKANAISKAFESLKNPIDAYCN